MAVNAIIKLPQTKATGVKKKNKGKEERERKKEGKKREGESWGRPTDLK